MSYLTVEKKSLIDEIPKSGALKDFKPRAKKAHEKLVILKLMDEKGHFINSEAGNYFLNKK